MSPRIVLVAHAATSATRRGGFPTDEAIEDPADIVDVPVRAAQVLTGPEQRCRQTAEALGWSASVTDDLADLDTGRWSGADLGALTAAEPASVVSWMTDPDANPHGGESLTDLVHRVGAVFDRSSWPDGRSLLVTSPLVVRAAVVHLLQAPSSLLFAVDIEPLAATVLTGHGGRWKLRALLPWGSWNDPAGRTPL
jgi:broad specificity phosphatase PhoE